MLLARPDEAERARDELQRATREMTATAAGGIDIARCLTELARAELAMGQPRKAADRAGEALEMLGSEPRPATAGALIVLGEARIRLGREEDAVEVLGRAMTCLQQMEPSREVAEGWFNLAELLSQTGDETTPRRGLPPRPRLRGPVTDVPRGSKCCSRSGTRDGLLPVANKVGTSLVPAHS